MKKLLIISFVAAFAACNSNQEGKVESMKSTGSDSMQQDTLSYPYTADYSSKFEMGNPKNALTILQLYKDWDNNTLNNSKSSFAEMNDTLVFYDGTMLAGSRDSIVAVSDRMRAGMGTVQSVVHAWLPLRSVDRNEDWVIVWVKELRTDAKGKKDSTELQETWRLDKDGKANLLYQYAQQPVKMPSSATQKK